MGGIRMKPAYFSTARLAQPSQNVGGVVNPCQNATCGDQARYVKLSPDVTRQGRKLSTEERVDLNETIRRIL